MPAASERCVSEVIRRTQERAARGLHDVRAVSRGASRRWLPLASAGVLALAGCSTPSANPVDWWHDLEGGPLAETRPPPPNADAPYPNLGQVPPKPAPPDPATRAAISAGLVADRANAQYTASLSPLQVTPPQAIPAPPPLPNNAANADQTSNATLQAASAPPPARIAPLGPPQPPLPNATPNPPRPAPVSAVTATPLPPLVAQPEASSDAAQAPAAAAPAAATASPPPAVAAAAPPAAPPPAAAPASPPSGPAVPLTSAQAAAPPPAPTPLAPAAPSPAAPATAAAAAGTRPPTPPRATPPRAAAPTPLAAATPAPSPAAPAAPPLPPAAPSQAASALLPGMPDQPPPMVQLSGTNLPSRIAPTPAPTPPVAPPAPVAAPQPGAPVAIAFMPGSAVLPTTALAPLKMLVQRRGDAPIAVTGYGEAASADPATLPAALQLALARARAIATNLLAAGVPSSSLRIATQARGDGGAAQIVSN